MNILFYIAAGVAVVSTVLVVTRRSGIHALLCLVVSLLSVAVIFFTLGAAFAAALEVIIYAGAIMVLFLFVIMMFNVGPADERRTGERPRPSAWIGPAVLAAVLLGELVYALAAKQMSPIAVGPVPPREVGVALFGPYVLAVELASVLLLAGLVGTYHLGRQEVPPVPDEIPEPGQPSRVRQRNV